VRRVYTAKIAGQKSAVTVAVYQGADAHEVCYIMILAVFIDYATLSGIAGGHGTLLTASVRTEKPRFSSIKVYIYSHPNLVQLCHFASSLTMQALVFNDGM
jgi:hypothetical protein